MARQRKPISDEALEKATGKTRVEWFTMLDKLGARTMTHKEIARLLADRRLIQSGWWCQMVTVEYEYARGRRTVGETEKAGYEVGVTKTVSATPQEVWQFLTSPAGRKIWLGDASPLKLKPRESFTANNGTAAEIRTLKSGQRIRLVWKPKGCEKPSTLQMTVSERQTAKRTMINFHQEKLTSAKQREAARRHWQAVLRRIDRLLEA